MRQKKKLNVWDFLFRSAMIIPEIPEHKCSVKWQLKANFNHRRDPFLCPQPQPSCHTRRGHWKSTRYWRWWITGFPWTALHWQVTQSLQTATKVLSIIWLERVLLQSGPTDVTIHLRRRARGRTEKGCSEEPRLLPNRLVTWLGGTEAPSWEIRANINVYALLTCIYPSVLPKARQLTTDLVID